MAARYGHAGALRILLSAKCDVDSFNLNHDTPLHITCAMGRRKLTKLLLESGAMQFKNLQHETPRDIAVRKNLVEILDILNAFEEKNKMATAAGPVSLNYKARRRKEAGEAKLDDGEKRNWSPYGCHYFPDPRNFPSPKLETLPAEPLSKGEQYFLDLAGNIRKGPIGIGNVCYCAPFFKEILNQNCKNIRKYVDRANEKLDRKVSALAQQIEQQKIAKDEGGVAVENWLERGRGVRATMAEQRKVKGEGTRGICRSKSLELVDDGGKDELLDQNLDPAEWRGSLENHNEGHRRIGDPAQAPQGYLNCAESPQSHAQVPQGYLDSVDGSERLRLRLNEPRDDFRALHSPQEPSHGLQVHKIDPKPSETQMDLEDDAWDTEEELDDYSASLSRASSNKNSLYNEQFLLNYQKQQQSQQQPPNFQSESPCSSTSNHIEAEMNRIAESILGAKDGNSRGPDIISDLVKYKNDIRSAVNKPTTIPANEIYVNSYFAAFNRAAAPNRSSATHKLIKNCQIKALRTEGDNQLITPQKTVVNQSHISSVHATVADQQQHKYFYSGLGRVRCPLPMNIDEIEKYTRNFFDHHVPTGPIDDDEKANNNFLMLGQMLSERHVEEERAKGLEGSDDHNVTNSSLV